MMLLESKYQEYFGEEITFDLIGTAGDEDSEQRKELLEKKKLLMDQWFEKEGGLHFEPKEEDEDEDEEGEYDQSLAAASGKSEINTSARPNDQDLSQEEM